MLFFDQVYQYACIEYSGWNNELGICDFAFSSFLPHEVNCFAQTVANVLNSVMEEISEAFNYACDQALEQIRASVVINGSLEADTIEDRDAVAMDQGFFESLRGLLLMSLQQIIEDSQKFEDVFLNKVLACIDNLPSSITCDDIEVNLKEGFKKAKDKLYEHLEEYKRTSGSKDLLPWYTACEKELEEPIADIFMIKASGISTKKYVDHLLHLYRHLNEQRLKRESGLRNKGMTTLLLDEIQKTENASRIIGIALARNESRYCFSRWYDWIAQCIPHRFKPRQYYEARKLLAAMYRAAQTSPTMHQELVYEYIRKVWEDPRYTDTFSKMKRQIKVKGFELQILRFLT